MSKSWTRLSRARPKKPSMSPRTIHFIGAPALPAFAFAFVSVMRVAISRTRVVALRRHLGREDAGEAGVVDAQVEHRLVRHEHEPRRRPLAQVLHARVLHVDARLAPRRRE